MLLAGFIEAPEIGPATKTFKRMVIPTTIPPNSPTFSKLLDLQFGIRTREGVEKGNHKRMDQERKKKHEFSVEGVGTTECSLKYKSRCEQRL